MRGKDDSDDRRGRRELNTSGWLSGGCIVDGTDDEVTDVTDVIRRMKGDAIPSGLASRKGYPASWTEQVADMPNRDTAREVRMNSKNR